MRKAPTTADEQLRVEHEGERYTQLCLGFIKKLQDFYTRFMTLVSNVNVPTKAPEKALMPILVLEFACCKRLTFIWIFVGRISQSVFKEKRRSSALPLRVNCTQSVDVCPYLEPAMRYARGSALGVLIFFTIGQRSRVLYRFLFVRTGFRAHVGSKTEVNRGEGRLDW